MSNQRLDLRRVPCSFLLATSVLVLLFSIGSAYGLVGYSPYLEPRTTVTSPPVFLQAGTAGTSTIYANSTSALTSVEGGCRNIVTNGNVTTTSNWTYTDISDPGAVVSGNYSSTIYRSASYSLYIQLVDNSASAGYTGSGKQYQAMTSVSTLPTSATLYFYYRIDAEGTASAEVANATVTITKPDSSTVTVFNTSVTFSAPTTGSWTYKTIGVSSVFTATGTYTLDLRGYFSTTSSKKPTLTVYYDDVWLNIVTPLNYDYVLKAVNQGSDAWKVRLNAYSQSNIGHLNNCTIYLYGRNHPITNMNFTGNANGWGSAHTSNGSITPTWTEVTWDSANGNPSPGSAGGSAYGGASESSTGKNLGTVIYNFSYTFTAPISGWTSVKTSFAWQFTATGTYTNNILNSVKLLLTDNSNVVLQTLYNDNNGGPGWTGQASVGYYYRTDITVSASMTAGNSYKLKVQFIDTDTVNGDNPSLTFRIDDIAITFKYGNSNQIIIINGSYTQQTGAWYDLAASGTIYIVMYTKASNIGTSYIYAYLEILVPNTTTYARYIITFKIT